jgi:subtilisin family serine protease
VNEGGCYEADILAGFDVAISDGVDVLSVSLGGAIDEYSDDAIAIGSFHAFKKGITVVASAGNSGPGPGSVSNVAPWLITVGASTLDRAFTIYVALGNRKHLKVSFFFPLEIIVLEGNRQGTRGESFFG